MLKRKIFISLLLIVILVIFNSIALAEKNEKVTLVLGTTNPSSGNYPWAVGITNVLNKFAEGIKVDCKSYGAGSINIPKLHKGETDMCTNATLLETITAFNGTVNYKDNPMPNLRVLGIREFNYALFYVTKESGIKDVTQLEGEKFRPGSPSSIVFTVIAPSIEKALGFKGNWVLGSTGAAIEAIKNRHAIGYAKSSPAIPPGPNFKTRFDASALDINSSIPLTVIGFTDEQKAKIETECPQISWGKVPAGGFKELPDLPAMWCCSFGWSGLLTTTKMPMEIQYKIVKTLDEHWQKEIASAYPPSANWDPVEDTIRTTHDLLLSPGLVKYAKEKGIFVPEELIPPEYYEYE